MFWFLNNLKAYSVSEMDFLSNLLPGVPSLELDPTSQYQNVTLLQNTFIGAFLGTIFANLATQTVAMILNQNNTIPNQLGIFFCHF